MPNAIPVVHHSLSDGRQEGRLISFAVSNTPETKAAFSWACSNLFHSIDRIILIHVYDGDSLFSLQSKQNGLSVLHHYRGLCEDKGFKCEIVHAHGSTAPVIAEISKSRGCDLCVIGSRGLNAFKRAVLGSVSSRVAQLCVCPVMVIKKPRDEAGAFLQVLPRRVFFYVDPENSVDAFAWGLDKLLDPQIDEVYLLANYAFAQKKAVPLADREQVRVELETTMEKFEEQCKDKGIRSVTRLRVNSIDQVLQAAVTNSCDTLIIERNPAGRRVADGGLYAAHNAVFPVIVVNQAASDAKGRGRQPMSPTAVAISPASSLSSAPTERSKEFSSGTWRDSGSWRSKVSVKQHAQNSDCDAVPAAPCSSVLKSSASADSQHLTKSSSTISNGDCLEQSILTKSSSLEALLNNLEAVDDPCISRSRRCDADVEESLGGETSRGRNSGIEEQADALPAHSPRASAGEEEQAPQPASARRNVKEQEAEAAGNRGEKQAEEGAPVGKKQSRALARSVSTRRFSKSMSELLLSEIMVSPT